MRAFEAAERLAEVLAIELAFAAQAEHVRQAEAGKVAHALAPAALGKHTQAALKAVQMAFPLVDADRELSWDMMQLAEKVLSGEIVAASGYTFARH
jgi:histidine ammonia-lyase